VQRDADAPDLGYHYDPIDYCLSNLNLTNATLYLTNGVVIASYGNGALTFRNGSSLISQGTPESPNHVVRFDVVQEQAYPAWCGAGLAVTFSDWGSTQLPYSLRWTQFSCLAGNSSHWLFGMVMSSLGFSNCEFHGGTLVDRFGAPTAWNLGVTNCLFDRVATTFGVPYGSQTINIFLRNNLFRNGPLTLAPASGASIEVYDNTFDNVALTQMTNNVPNGFNGYINTTLLLPNATNNVVHTNFMYQLGPLGFWYYGQTNFTNRGSRSAAAAGLYHFTTSTNQVKETNSVVDIGFHYVAVGSQGVAIDTDGDGNSDAREDLDGDGTVDSGETDWQNAADQGLRVQITEPKPNTRVP
jgi:hypothetical protein